MSRRLARLATAVAIPLVLGARPVAAQEAVEYYATDALGSVRVVFASNGTVKGRMDFGPYGEQLTTAEGIGQKVFAQITFDGETSMDYAEARMFQIRTGRFNAPDAIFNALEQPQAWNRYSYALNSPLVFTDATGLNADACEGWFGDASTCVSGNPSRIDPLWSVWAWTWGGHGWTSGATEGGGGVFLPPPQTTPPGPQPAPQGPVDDVAQAVAEVGHGDPGGVPAGGEKESPWERVKSCVAAQYGFGDGKTPTGLDLGRMASELGAIPIPKAMVGLPVIGESSNFTNALNYGSHLLGINGRFSGATARGLARSAFGSVRIATVVGRANVAIGAALFAYDAASITACAVR